MNYNYFITTLSSKMNILQVRNVIMLSHHVYDIYIVSGTNYSQIVKPLKM